MDSLATKAQITDATLEQRLAGLGYSLVVGIVCWGLLSVILSSVLSRSLKEGIWLATLSLAGISCLVSIAIFVRSFLNKGEVLEDCGPHPMWKHAAIFCGLFVFIFLISFATEAANAATQFTLPWMMAVHLCIALGRLQICQNGLMLYNSLIRWEQIQAYDWAEDGSLLIRRSSRFPQPRTVVPLPAVKRTAVERALAELCRSNRHGTSAIEGRRSS